MNTTEVDELAAGYKGVWARVTGDKVIPLVLGIVGVSLIVAVQVYAMNENKRGYAAVTAKLDNAMCVLSLNEPQRQAMRTDLVEVARVGGDVQRQLSLGWCPWIPITSK
jgi:hypothetical protein